MRISGIIYKNTNIEDESTYKILPDTLKVFLKQVNGLVAYKGALHIRGCTNSPAWHSIDEVWTGKRAFWKHYPDVLDTDVPFGQDCMADQFLLRGNKVIKLFGETGEIEELNVDFTQFLEKAENDPLNFLGMHPLLQYEMENKALEPGQILNAYPPFCLQQPGVTIKAVPVEEQLDFLINFSKQLRNSDEGDSLDFIVN